MKSLPFSACCAADVFTGFSPKRGLKTPSKVNTSFRSVRQARTVNVEAIDVRFVTIIPAVLS